MTLPIWYQVSIIGIVISTFGLRFMMGRFFGNKKPVEYKVLEDK